MIHFNIKQFRSNWKYNKIIKNGVFNTSFDGIVCTTRAFSDVIHILESTNTNYRTAFEG